MGLKDFLFGGKAGRRDDHNRNKDFDDTKGSYDPSVPRDYTPLSLRYYVLEECMTGITEYGYFCEGRPVGAALVHCVPGFPVRLQGEGLNLRSEFDKTIFPGVIREIQDEVTGQIYAQVSYYGAAMHTLTLPGWSLMVHADPDGYRFHREGKLIAKLRKTDDPAQKLILTVWETIPDHVALLMMSFPLLRISW